MCSIIDFAMLSCALSLPKTRLVADINGVHVGAAYSAMLLVDAM